MKKSFKKTISVLLSLLMALSVFGALTVSVGATNYYGVETAASSLRTGDLFEMGMYPQTKVADASLLSSLSQIDCEMKSYGYLKNADGETGSAGTVDMQYADIAFDGELYRKVTINEKRPHSTKNVSGNNSYTTQADNGYFVGRTYYFKWEPIIWRVLAQESDGVAVMSYRLLDAQTFNDYFGAVTWETSSLREWLNGDFLRLAFSDAEREDIVTVVKEHDDNPDLGTSGGNDTTDTLWILSLKEVVRQDYGFRYTNDADASKVAKGTDYAMSQGLWAADNGNSEWWQRTAGGASTLVCIVDSDGATRNIYDEACVTSNGVRPAFKLDLNAIVGVSDSDVCRFGHTPGYPVEENVLDATCTVPGSYDAVTYCTVCGDELIRDHETIPAPGHTAGEPVTENRVEATCTEDGGRDIVIYCTVCGDELIRDHETIPASGHTEGYPVAENVVEATCTSDGSYEVVTYCTVCGDELHRVKKTEAAPGHVEGKAKFEDFVEPTCTQDGSYSVVVRCTVCGEELSRTAKTLAARGHMPGKPVAESVKPATSDHEGSYILVTYCEECGEELDRETVVTPKLESDETSGAKPCPWCGKTVHHTVWEDFVHSVFTFLKVMLERLKFFQ